MYFNVFWLRYMCYIFNCKAHRALSLNRDYALYKCIILLLLLLMGYKNVKILPPYFPHICIFKFAGFSKVCLSC